jgi:putative hemolysin
MSIDDVERLLGRGNMRSGDDYTTLAGFVLAQLGHLPATGESFRWRGFRFEVVDMDGRRIDKLLVQLLAPG